MLGNRVLNKEITEQGKTAWNVSCESIERMKEATLEQKPEESERKQTAKVPGDVLRQREK